MDHKEGLNKAQKEAVLHTAGPMLIIAGAGAGKTKTITHRIINLIKCGTSPSKILAITFTNKAAKEMRERVENLMEIDSTLNLPISMRERPFMSTFHALGVHILKENSQSVGISRHFTIYDKADGKRAVKEALEEMNLDPKQYEPSKILSIISKNKGDMITAIQYENEHTKEYFAKIVSQVWNKYEASLKKENALDFDDLLLKTALLLKNNKEVREHYQKIWEYIHIDEYQDTNKVQYMIATLLAQAHRNICVVGDIDQMIYTWRGASIQNILNFETDYLDTKVVLLEENYRSTQTILTAANRIIEKNVMRRKKVLFTKNEEGEKISTYMGFDENDEARFVADTCKNLIDQGINPKEIAVLYRANFQSRALEEYFLSKSVPYQILGTRFFERKEVKDILSFVRAALNPDSFADIKRIINVPPRGIGKVTLIKILAGKEKEFTGAMRQKIVDFRTLLARVNKMVFENKPSEVVKFILQESGLEKILRSGTEEDKERLENIRELVTLATKYDFLPQEEGIEKLLEDAALASDQDELQKDQTAVKLMTVHASKGLEFDYVFVTGLEEELFPHQKIGGETENEEESEEERRLFYVALTRARKKIFLTYTQMRTIFGSKKVNIMSQFISDIDEDL
ncbi:MAG: ATP-dependent DNA helicase PcrA, partial [Candidatus Taylorbacteria bacterium]|nr:ATP-dependent DNA helicase PcrA [Candidatus Taylorbacteria bacterium]